MLQTETLSHQSWWLLSPKRLFQKVICSLCGIIGLLTFIVMVFHCDNRSPGCSGVVYDGFWIQGFDGKRVNHTDVDSLWGRREEGGGCAKYFILKHHIINIKTQYSHDWFVFLCLGCSAVSTFFKQFGCRQSFVKGHSCCNHRHVVVTGFIHNLSKKGKRVCVLNKLQLWSWGVEW